MPINPTDDAPDFIPDSEMASSGPPDFLSDEEAMKMMPSPEPGITEVESGLIGAGQGLSFGFGDELVGAGKAAYGKVFGEDERPWSDSYRANQKEVEDYISEAAKQNPKSYLAGNVAGGVASVGVPGLGMLAPAKGLSAAANIGRAAAGGAVNALGNTTAHPFESPEGLKKASLATAGGAALGGMSQYGLDKITKALGAFAPDKLRRFAEERAVVATGPTAAERKALNSSGNLHSQGRELLDRKIVTPGADLLDISERAGKELNVAGPKIGKAVSDVDELIAKAKERVMSSGESEDAKMASLKAIDDEFGFNMGRVSDKIKKNLISENDFNPNLEGEVAKLKKLASSYEGRGTLPLSQGQKIKTSQRRLTNMDSDTIPQGFKKDIYNIIGEEMDSSVGKTGSLRSLAETGSPSGPLSSENDEILKAYKDANKTYGIMSDVKDRADNRYATQSGQRQMSMTDYLALIGGLSSGNPGIGAAAALTNKVARKYGPSTQAVGFDKLANLLDKTPDALKSVSGTGYDLLERGGKTAGLIRAEEEVLNPTSKKKKKSR